MDDDDRSQESNGNKLRLALRVLAAASKQNVFRKNDAIGRRKAQEDRLDCQEYRC